MTFRSECILRIVNFEKYKLGNVTILMKILQNYLKQDLKKKNFITLKIPLTFTCYPNIQ